MYKSDTTQSVKHSDLTKVSPQLQSRKMIPLRLFLIEDLTNKFYILYILIQYQNVVL